jgi:hypothetical protein
MQGLFIFLILLIVAYIINPGILVRLFYVALVAVVLILIMATINCINYPPAPEKPFSASDFAPHKMKPTVVPKG